MNTNVLSPLGIEITDLVLEEVDGHSVASLRNLLAEHGVMVMRRQTINDEIFLQFLQTFGDMAFTEGEQPLEGFPDLNFVSNIGRTTPPRSNFHVDTSYVAVPPAYTALRAVQIPASGGETLFTNQYRAYETLPDDVRTRLEGRTIRHVVTGLELGPEAETEAEHPVFRLHPLTGRTSLYLSTPQRCAAISGMDPDSSREMIEFLFAHSTREENTLRHAWAEGDVVMWDNGCVLHKADHSGVVGDRVMHRGMVARYAA